MQAANTIWDNISAAQAKRDRSARVPILRDEAGRRLVVMDLREVERRLKSRVVEQ